jgi:hypothetical protein
MGVIAVRKTLRGRAGPRSDAQESQKGECEMISHVTHRVHDDTPLALPKVRIADNLNQSESIHQPIGNRLVEH